MRHSSNSPHNSTPFHTKPHRITPLSHFSSTLPPFTVSIRWSTLVYCSCFHTFAQSRSGALLYLRQSVHSISATIAINRLVLTMPTQCTMSFSDIISVAPWPDMRLCSIYSGRTVCWLVRRLLVFGVCSVGSVHHLVLSASTAIQ